LTEPGSLNVIMVEFPRNNGVVRHYVNLCEEHAIRLLVMADLDKMFHRPVAVFQDRDVAFIQLREEPLENPINRFFKRCLDLAVSVPVVLFILPPLILIVWILQRWCSPGPLFFHQHRDGFHNEPFQILKFRTMLASGPANDKLPSSGNDSRLFRGSGFLRKTSLDEMPQFWNVLCGQMSVVGPRPHLASDNQAYRRIFRRAYVRSFVKPGITGLAQARGFRGSGATPEDVAFRMESDIEYLENWSFWLDCWLILRTSIEIIVPPKGAV
jgi:putative colanic acid biosynthesis UDP-glucose lipid carrier transferase